MIMLRWDGATSAAEILGGWARGKRVPEAAVLVRRDRNYARTKTLLDANCESNGRNIAYTTETSPQASAHAKAWLSSCKYGTPVNRIVVFSSLCGAGAGILMRCSEYHAEVRRGVLADLRCP